MTPAAHDPAVSNGTHVAAMNVHKESVSWGYVRGETLSRVMSMPT